MRIIITGALGHIGSKLIRELPSKIPPSKIILIDNMLTQRYSSLFHLDSKYDYHFLEEDILEYDLESLLRSDDIVIHLAAITDATNSFKNPEQVELINFQGTKKVAKACSNKKAKLIFLSTTSVYGAQENIVDELTPITDLSPLSPYATSKLNCEEMLKENKKNLDFVILRFGTIFSTSEGMRFHTVINKFCFEAITNRPISIWKTALNQVRPYLDLEDAINAISHIINQDLFNQQIYNVLTDNYSINQIVIILEKLLQKPIHKNFIDSPIMNQYSYHVSNKKFSNTGFMAQGNIEEGIKKTLNLLEGIKSI